eukprot:scaffold8289_cov60-Phaeocystis_antarctica.AAC.1
MSGAASRDKRRARAGGRHARFADSWFTSWAGTALKPYGRTEFGCVGGGRNNLQIYKPAHSEHQPRPATAPPRGVRLPRAGAGAARGAAGEAGSKGGARVE